MILRQRPATGDRPIVLLSLLLSIPLLFIIGGSTSQLLAQPGRLSGTVRERGGEGLPGATIYLYRTDQDDAPRGGVAKADGSFEITAIPPATYRVNVSSIGYGTGDTTIVISPGTATRLDIILQPEEGKEGTVIVTASRRPEKATSAPASTSVVSAEKVEATNAVTPVDYVRGVKGLDMVQGGLVQGTIVARGFNNAFSGSLTTLTDNRFASVPSLRYNGYYFIPLVNEDIERIEIVRGPGSALYGPNASNGVMHIITRSPFSSKGTSVSVVGGERDLIQGMFRHAGTVGERIGYKISGQYMRGIDWPYIDTAETSARADFIAANPGIDVDTLKIAARDSVTERFGGEARLDWYIADDASLILSTGYTQAIRNVDATGVGAAEAQDWGYWYHQARFRWKNLFVQSFLNRSNAGETYLLRTGQPIIDRSTLLAFQAQHATDIGEKEHLTYGVDLIFTNPVTDSTVTGGHELDDNITETGIYVQSETSLIDDQLSLVGALRFDIHSRLDDPILSPRAAVVWTPENLGAFRLTYNRAYSAPSTNDLFLDIVAEQTPYFGIRASGVPESGYHFRYDQNGAPMMRSPFAVDPSAFIGINDMGALWNGIKKAVAENATPELAAIIQLIPAPPLGSLQGELRYLNPNTGTFDAANGRTVKDRPPIRPTINNTIELGWQGYVTDRIGLSIDLYRSHYTDFIGPLETITPTVFLERNSLIRYLTDALVTAGVQQPIAMLIANLGADSISGQAGTKNIGLPLGNVTPEEATAPNDIMLSYRNYGNITLYGLEFGTEVRVMEGLALNGNVSWVDNNYFENLDSVSDLSLNAPKFKFNVGADWRHIRLGLRASALYRHVDGFRVNSGVYFGEVPSYSTLSLAAGYDLPFLKGLSINLSTQNLLTFVEDGEENPFEQRHIEFIGTPAIGRLITARATYEF